jgi:hypothetical protein
VGRPNEFKQRVTKRVDDTFPRAAFVPHLPLGYHLIVLSGLPLSMPRVGAVGRVVDNFAPIAPLTGIRSAA